jgi:hypothetical protein
MLSDCTMAKKFPQTAMPQSVARNLLLALALQRASMQHQGSRWPNFMALGDRISGVKGPW